MRKLLAILVVASCGLLGQNQRYPAADQVFLPDALEYLKSDKSTDRSFALATMGLMGKDAASASRLVVKAFFDTNADVRQAANLCLKNVNPPIYQPVVDLATSKDYDTRMKAANELAKMGKDAAPTVPALLEFLKDGAKPGDRASIVKSLGDVGAADKEITPMIAQLAIKDPDPAVRLAAMKALPKMSDSGGQLGVVLEAAAKDKNMANRVEAITVLGTIGKGNQDAIKVLQGMLNDAAPQVREAAKKALANVQK